MFDETHGLQPALNFLDIQNEVQEVMTMTEVSFRHVVSQLQSIIENMCEIHTLNTEDVFDRFVLQQYLAGIKQDNRIDIRSLIGSSMPSSLRSVLESAITTSQNNRNENLDRCAAFIIGAVAHSKRPKGKGTQGGSASSAYLSAPNSSSNGHSAMIAAPPVYTGSNVPGSGIANAGLFPSKVVQSSVSAVPKPCHTKDHVGPQTLCDFSTGQSDDEYGGSSPVDADPPEFFYHAADGILIPFCKSIFKKILLNYIFLFPL